MRIVRDDLDIRIGNIHDVANPGLLLEENITVILNVANDGYVPWHYDCSDMVIMKFGLDDPPKDTRNINKHFWEVVKIVNVAYNLATAKDGKLLIICNHGRNRSAHVVAGWLMKEFDINMYEAIELAQVQDYKNWMRDLGFIFPGDDEKCLNTL